MLTKLNSKQEDIYIVFLSTNTLVGKGIRFLTGNRFSHVTISLDQELRMMYSFARYHINSPIRGGFVIEQPFRYLYNNQDVSVKVCRIRVSREEYDRILSGIGYFLTNREQLIYNTPNALLSLFKRQLTVKDMYTCLEFVTYLLRYENILTIRELENRLKQQVVYRGSLKKIVSPELAWQEDDYFIRKDVFGIVSDTVHHIRKVTVRIIHA